MESGVGMTRKPFREALLELLEKEGISQRELIRRTRRHGWGATGTITNIMSADSSPSVRAMEAIARALQIKPEHFAEYRLAKARNALDPDIVGVDAALNGLGAAKLALAGK
jgi:transcriptional regulator with XRE-family HTH domain